MSATKHIEELCAGFEDLKRQMSSRPITAKTKAALRVMDYRVEQARNWATQQGTVQRALFADTPRVPAVPYSDPDTSMRAAGVISSSGKAKVYEALVLKLLRVRPRTCKELVDWFIDRDIGENRRPGSYHPPVSARLVDLRSKGFTTREGERPTTPGKFGKIHHITRAGLEQLAAIKGAL